MNRRRNAEPSSGRPRREQNTKSSAPTNSCRPARRGDDLTRLTIAHPGTLPDATPDARPLIEVTTSTDGHPPCELFITREGYALRVAADAELTDGLSDAAVILRFRAVRRRRVAAAHAMPVGEAQITIDGSREPFVMVGDRNELWVAVRRHHDVTITITARGIDPASLVIEPVADPSARLLGPEPAEQ